MEILQPYLENTCKPVRPRPPRAEPRKQNRAWGPKVGGVAMGARCGWKPLQNLANMEILQPYFVVFPALGAVGQRARGGEGLTGQPLGAPCSPPLGGTPWAKVGARRAKMEGKVGGTQGKSRCKVGALTKPCENGNPAALLESFPALVGVPFVLCRGWRDSVTRISWTKVQRATKTVLLCVRFSEKGRCASVHP